MYRRISCLALGALLTACATSPQPTTPPPQPHVEAAKPSAEADPQSDLLFHVLSAEMAAKQGNTEQALKSYLAASRLSDDPQLAERATRIGVYLGDRDGTLEAANRWKALAPKAPEPNEALAILELRAGNEEAARDHLVESVRQHPAGPGEGASRAGALLAREEDRAAALRVLRGLAEMFDEEPNAHLAVAELALQAKAPQEAVAAAERAQALDPEWTAPALLKVRAWLQAGEGGKAMSLLEETLKRRPDDYDLRLQYARTLLTLEQSEKALTQFERLLKAQPQDGQVLYVAALIALEIGETGKARDYLLRLVNVGQHVHEAYYYLGRVAQAEGDRKGALRWFGQVQGELRPEALMRTAMMLAKDGDLATARTRLQEVRRDFPQSAARSYLVEGDLLRSKGEFQQAYELYSEVLGRDAENWEIRYARALTAVQLDRIAEAEQDLRQLLTARPDSAQALNALGYTLVDRTDRYQEGFELVKRAHELRPEDPAIVDSLGWAHYRLGQLVQARQYLEQAHALSAEGEIAAHYAEVLWKLGQRAEARRVLADALKKEPKSKLLLDAKRRLK